jgi:hypothetical protein
MLRICVVAWLSLATSSVSAGLARQTPSSFDPAGEWTVSTTDDTGQPMSVSVQIAGRGGAYTGQARAGERILPLRDLATTPAGMIAIFNLPQGAIVVRLIRDAEGKYSGAWGEVAQTFALTATRKGR